MDKFIRRIQISIFEKINKYDSEQVGITFYLNINVVVTLVFDIEKNMNLRICLGYKVN